MPLIRIQLDSDKSTARRVVELHRAGRSHRDSVDAARAEVWRRGHTPAADPVFVGVTNGQPVRLIYDAEVHLGAVP